jgi:protocatechuate 3,4-dioxygenase beta subunit
MQRRPRGAVCLCFTLALLTDLSLDAAPPPAPRPALPAEPEVLRGEAAQVQLAGEAARKRWLQVFPLTPHREDRLFLVEDGTRAVALDSVEPGPAMLCAGGMEVATRCERVLVEKEGFLTLAAPVAGVRVTGRLLVGRNPVSGARIAVVPEPLPARRFFSIPLFREGEHLETRVLSDEKGRFTIPLLAPGDYRLDIRSPGGRLDHGEPFTVPDPRKLRTRADPPGPPLFDLGDLGLADGVRVEVTVTDSSGRPLNGAGVGAGQGLRLERTYFEAYANADGIAVLSGVDAAKPIGITCVAPGYVRWEKEFETIPSALRCALDRYSGIEGTVIDEDGEPVAGATVTVRPLEFARSVPTSEDGTFTFGEMTAGEYRLLVAASGYRTAEREVALAAQEQANLDPIRLLPAEALDGRVVDGLTGEPVGTASVTVKDPPGAGAAVTDEEGKFTLWTGSDETLWIEVAAAGYPPATVGVTAERQAAPEPLEIELLAGGRVHVSVWDEEADAPCRGCSLSLGGEGRSHSLTTNADGEALSELLSPGRYYASLVQMRSLGSVVTVSSGDQIRRFTIEPGQTTRVQFGEKRQTVEVLFSPPPPPGWKLLAEVGPRADLLDPQPDGSFLVRRPPGQAVKLTLEVLGSVRVRQAVLPADFDQPVVRLELAETQVRGTLVRGQEPLASDRLEIVSVAEGAVAALAKSDAAGVFVVPYLPPGGYQLLVENRRVGVFELAEGASLDLGRLAVPD